MKQDKPYYNMLRHHPEKKKKTRETVHQIKAKGGCLLENETLIIKHPFSKSCRKV